MDFIEGGVLPERYGLPNNKSTKWYYDALNKMQDSIKQKESGSSGKSKETPNNKKSDPGNNDDDEKEEEKEGEGEGDSDNQNNSQTGAGSSNLTKEEENLKNDLMSHEERFKHHWEKQLEGLTDLEKQMVKNNIQHTLKKTVEEHGLRSKGHVPGYLKDMIDDLFQIKPENFDWKAFYRRFLGVSVSSKRKPTRKRQSKRFPDFQGTKTKKQHRILYAVDTSNKKLN